MNQTPLKQTPRVVATGSLSKPKAQPKPNFQGPQLPTPRVVGSGSLSHPKPAWR